VSRGALSAVAVLQAFGEVANPRPLIERQGFEHGRGWGAFDGRIEDQLALAGMLQNVSAGFGYHNHGLLCERFVQTHLCRHFASDAASLRRFASFVDQKPVAIPPRLTAPVPATTPQHYFHLRIETLVPAPGFEEISKFVRQALGAT